MEGVKGEEEEEDQPWVLTVKHERPEAFNKPCVSHTGGKWVTRHFQQLKTLLVSKNINIILLARLLKQEEIMILLFF